tara:strand:+ start:1439 stop:1792 length:354 start_codon:yes stop_codon:yes gene_type:complete
MDPKSETKISSHKRKANRKKKKDGANWSKYCGKLTIKKRKVDDDSFAEQPLKNGHTHTWRMEFMSQPQEEKGVVTPSIRNALEAAMSSIAIQGEGSNSSPPELRLALFTVYTECSSI